MTSQIQPAETSQEAAVTTWAIDQVHSNVEFAVKHMMISTVRGRFHQFEGVLVLDEANPAASSVNATIDAASVDTNADQRDAHLRSDDFFNADLFPKITFRSTKIEGKGDDWKMTGDLTIRNVTKSVVLDVEFEGRGPDPMGGQRAGFTATTKINRKDFGVNFNAALETGGLLVGDDVKITLNIEAVLQQ